ncbi:pectinesterase family protein [Streptomyces sp. SID8358]|uniref:pectinesterase family protein n=1 Tax=Streptomyces sp. SID8358 TaxID=2690342 RepID=UPI000DB3EF46|nr:pectinesterase family protein [Streptomyces sp. SID8358]
MRRGRRPARPPLQRRPGQRRPEARRQPAEPEQRLAGRLGAALLEPDDGWLDGLPRAFTGRRVRRVPLDEARRARGPQFVKPPTDKSFPAAVHETGETLPTPAGHPHDVLVQISEVVIWVREFRLFLLDGEIRTGSRCATFGRLDAAPLAGHPDEGVIRAFARRLMGECGATLPSGVVVDVGLMRGRTATGPSGGRWARPTWPGSATCTPPTPSVPSTSSSARRARRPTSVPRTPVSAGGDASRVRERRGPGSGIPHGNLSGRRGDYRPNPTSPERTDQAMAVTRRRRTPHGPARNRALVAGATAFLAVASLQAFGPAPDAAAATTLTVAKDGTGQYTTVQAAVNAIPAGNTARVVVSIRPGTYRETVKIPSNKQNVTLQGSGSSRKDTVIVHANASGTPKPDGSGTYGTSGSATVAAEADGFQARNLTISNDFDEAAHQDMADRQAVALRTAADKVFLDSVIVTGDQDTLLLDTASKAALGRVYMVNSYVVGNVDFIFGRASAVIDRSVITLKKRWDGSSAGYVTAPSTAAGRKGFLITASTVNGDVAAAAFHLGRPWHAGGDASLDPMATFRDTTLGAGVKSAPWTDMSGFSWKDDRFAEYRNTGPGSGPASSERPQLTDSQAAAQETADWLAGWTPTAS